MEEAQQPSKSKPGRIWFFVLLAIAFALLAPTYFALRWLLNSHLSQASQGAVVPEVVGSFRADYQPEQPKAGWRYLWNANGPLGDANSYAELRWNGQRYTPEEQYPAPAPAGYLRVSSSGGHAGQGRMQTGPLGANAERAAIIAFTVPKKGPYAIRDSFINRLDGDKGGEVQLRVFVNSREVPPVVPCATREQLSFDRDLGELTAGDNIYVSVSPGDIDQYDSFGIDFSIAIQAQGQTPAVITTPDVSAAPLPARTRLPIVAKGRFYPVPLEGFYQRLLESYRPTDSWGVVPRGAVELDGIPFLMRGKIEMNGIGASRSGDFKPTRVGEVPVNRRAARLHLIGGAGYKDPDGTPVAELRLHYANGERRNVFINYGDHIRNWHEASDERQRDVNDPRCYIVWDGTHPTTGGPLRLFKSTFDNPLPSQEIRGLEFLSLFGNSFLAICAITLEDAASGAAPTASHAQDPDDASYRRETLVRVIDQTTGQSISNAVLTLTVEEGGRQYGFGRYRSDGLGQVLLDYPPGRFSQFRLQFAAPAYLPLIETPTAPDGVLPSELVLRCAPQNPLGVPVAQPPVVQPIVLPGPPAEK